MASRLAALAFVFLAAHLPFLPPTLEDIDSINFALGVREFDVARHQPHPPGYPVFIALSWLSTSVFTAAGVPGAAARGLAVWSALSGALLVWLLFVLYRRLVPPRRAFAATIVVVACPLFWFTALRPLSDMMGLAVVVAAQALILAPLVIGAGPAAAAYARVDPRRLLVAGAFLAGLAIGIRSQSFVLTLPLLGLVLLTPQLPQLGLRTRLAAVGAAALGAVAWGIPLLVASGGLERYLVALGSQAGEDFGGVVMLWTTRTPQVALAAFENTFLWPWGRPPVGRLVLLAALVGFVRLAWESPRAATVLTVAYLPYAIFHLLFQETVTVRYALPLVVPTALLVVVALDGRWRAALPAGVALLAVFTLVPSLRATWVYGREPSPAFRLLEDVARSDDGRPLGFHGVMRRPVEWVEGSLGRPLLAGPHGHEWLALVAHWREAPDARIWFAADPRRTDLALFDPMSRRHVRAYSWNLRGLAFAGGARPAAVDLHELDAPGWMLDRGWSITAETAGVATRDRAGPHVAPVTAWVAAREEETLLALGGRHLGGGGDSPVRLEVFASGEPVAGWDVPPGFFFHTVTLPAGRLAGNGYLSLHVRARAHPEGSAPPPLALEQFDIQGPDIVMFGFEDGWQEPEYSPRTGRSWRWMTDRATLWVRSVGRDLRLVLEGESPLRYYDAAPEVVVSIGGQEVGRLRPAADFVEEVALPAAMLAAAGGAVVVESSRWFVPGERQVSPDQRRLALRIYSVAVR